MSQLVLDASIALSWLLPDEAVVAAVAVQAELARAEHVWVAAHWRLEVANSLCMAERRKRLDAAGVARAVSLHPVEALAAFGIFPALVAAHPVHVATIVLVSAFMISALIATHVNHEPVPRGWHESPATDRKSTRLNSSH